MIQSPTTIIACRALQDLLSRLPPEALARQAIYTDYGLHHHPSKLNETVQGAIDGLEEPGLVVLGYGLCGDGLDRVKAGPHTLVMPRVDDCIALLLGSYQAYAQQLATVPGTYFLSKGCLESGHHPATEYEEYAQRYGPEDAAMVMDMQYRHYERLAFVAHSQADLDRYRPQAQQVGRFCQRWGMRYEEILGSEAYVRRLIEVATDPSRGDENFLVIPPGGQIRQEDFLRG